MCAGLRTRRWKRRKDAGGGGRGGKVVGVGAEQRSVVSSTENWYILFASTKWGERRAWSCILLVLFCMNMCLSISLFHPPHPPLPSVWLLLSHPSRFINFEEIVQRSNKHKTLGGLVMAQTQRESPCFSFCTIKNKHESRQLAVFKTLTSVTVNNTHTMLPART